ncbi:GIY-YIG nuclease family protein [Alkalicoccus luteus]|uniref:GIY-YIG nuclease family protein n=1 Tax=Alkalicoccus luteus TaxID=1237094 RepID=A0A969TT99_9BACI|nr:GIY-YIG nuclease family protein [Alkalicoccus luteus]NJP36040.1 GIY-YIG nuclease family protein [Alkalicoccus luteus]
MNNWDQVKAFADETGLLPTSNKNWVEVYIVLFSTSPLNEYMELKKRILHELQPKKSGIYVILKDERVLYIGESKDIGKRLLRHLAKIYVRKDGRAEFFKQTENQGKLSIRYLSLNSTEVSIRLSIENILTYILEPEYELWKTQKSMQNVKNIRLFP